MPSRNHELNNRTYNDHRAGDGDSGHGSMGDGVFPVGIVDALVVAVDSSPIGFEPQREDG